MEERTIERRRFENAEHLIQSLGELVECSGRNASEIYVSGECHDRGMATLIEVTLEDGSTVYNIVLSSR